MRKIKIGKLHVDEISFNEAIEKICHAASHGFGGYVVTPNVDHVCLAESDPQLVMAYEHAYLSLVDGAPLVFLLHYMGFKRIEKISGSDLMLPLLTALSEAQIGVYFLGSTRQSSLQAQQRLQQRLPQLRICGSACPPIGFEQDGHYLQTLMDDIKVKKAQVMLVALGAPKQELFMYQMHKQFFPCVAIGVGGSIDFLSGAQKRAPAYLSNWGLEWLYRLVHQPKRLFYRYLVRDAAFAGILVNTLFKNKNDLIV